MAFVVTKGERRLNDLVERAFGSELTAAERKRAAAALRRANPGVTKLEELAAGSVIMIPRVPGLQPTAGVAAGETVVSRARTLAEDLGSFTRDLEQSLEEERERLSVVLEIVSSNDVRDVVASEPGGEERIDSVAQITKARLERQEQSRAVIEELARTADELLELAERLR
jgi:hypothetical protein